MESGIHSASTADRDVDDPRPRAEPGGKLPVGSVEDLDKIIIAIHGIGSQRRSDTIRAVARRFGDRNCPPLPVMPLGYFSLGKVGEVQVSRLDAPDSPELRRIGFAEVFWADIPRQVVKLEDTLEESKAWGASVVSRSEAAYRKLVGGGILEREDFQLAGTVLDEVVETIRVMESLLGVFDKLGLFKFDLAPLLRDYVGDVQLVTEFKYYRQKIIARFHSAMAQICDQYPNRKPEIYIVAHSEGTVVSFLGLLQALAGKAAFDPDTPATPISTDWIRHVRGFMTIGSPIDKHLVLWPKLWDLRERQSGADDEGPDRSLQSRVEDDGSVVFDTEQGHERMRLPQQIQWRNYYDLADPIGFQLELAAGYLDAQHCRAFAFDTAQHDFGFSRYWLPGKAHNDYWDDAEVFGHFIDDVVLRQAPADAPALPPPRSRALAPLVSTGVPYLLAAALHLAAVFLLYKGLTTFLTPAGGSYDPPLAQTTAEVMLMGLLLMGVTVAARLPRLVKTTGARWHALAFVAFAIGAAPTWLAHPADLAQFLVEPFVKLMALLRPDVPPDSVAVLLVVAAAVAASGWLVPRKPHAGRRVLIACGVLAVLTMVAGSVIASEANQPLWPLVLAGLAFLYLWWLGILLFDLAFIWHRYIRESVAVDTLAAWARGEDARPDPPLRSGHVDPPAGAPT